MASYGLHEKLQGLGSVLSSLVLHGRRPDDVSLFYFTFCSGKHFGLLLGRHFPLMVTFQSEI